MVNPTYRINIVRYFYNTFGDCITAIVLSFSLNINEGCDWVIFDKKVRAYRLNIQSFQDWERLESFQCSNLAEFYEMVDQSTKELMQSEQFAQSVINYAEIHFAKLCGNI